MAMSALWATQVTCRWAFHASRQVGLRRLHQNPRRQQATAAAYVVAGSVASTETSPTSWTSPPARTLRPTAMVPKTLNILSRRNQSAFYDAISLIMKFRQRYIDDRMIFIKGEDMIQIARGLGAKEEDFAKMAQVSDGLRGDPTLDFRYTSKGRYCYDFDEMKFSRLEFQPFRLSVKEDFHRHDSDQMRYFDEVEDDLQLNTVMQALLLFKSFFLHGVPTRQRPYQDYESNKFIHILFNTRTFTTPEIQGEPALEGVHTDGVDHTMTVMLGAQNMTHDSAVTLVHDLGERVAVPVTETKGSLVRGAVKHTHFLDTLMLLDNEHFHSVTPIYAHDKEEMARRDMLVMFSRRQALDNHASAGLDSIRPHQTLTMEMPLWVP